METKNNSSPLISVVVCTYNRVVVLKDVLQTLAAQTLDNSFFELIIVDNNSSDGTDKVAKEFCGNHQNARYFLELQQGLSYARNRGWQEGKGEYIAYVDDDCKIPNQFLETAKSIIEKEAPIIFGGPAFSFYNSEKPYWYKDKYGSHEPFSEKRILGKDECHEIFGMNMFFRRFVLEDFVGFDPKLGMVGNKVAYCEETALLLRVAENFPDYKFIVTGSSTFEIRRKFKDSLAGRKKIINIAPLSFKEFLAFKNNKEIFHKPHRLPSKDHFQERFEPIHPFVFLNKHIQLDCLVN